MRWAVLVYALPGLLALAWVLTDADRIGWRKAVEYLTGDMDIGAAGRIAASVLWVVAGVLLWPLMFAIHMGWIGDEST